MFESVFCPSWRVTPVETEVFPPAFEELVEAVKPGVKSVGPQPPPEPSPSTVNDAVGVEGALPLYGVIELVVTAAPQVSGVARTARGPPLNVSVKSVNGVCGVSANVAVSRPVTGSAATEPLSRTSSPDGPVACRKSRYGSLSCCCPTHSEPVSGSAR